MQTLWKGTLFTLRVGDHRMANSTRLHGAEARYPELRVTVRH